MLYKASYRINVYKFNFRAFAGYHLVTFKNKLRHAGLNIWYAASNLSNLLWVHLIHYRLLKALPLLAI